MIKIYDRVPIEHSLFYVKVLLTLVDLDALPIVNTIVKT